MQEKQVTVAGHSLPLDKPFFVLATQNPIEMEGTYPLPEAQLDRFMFNIVIDYLSEDEEVAVVSQTTGAGAEEVKPVFTGADLLKCHQVVRRVPIAEEVVRYAVRIAANTRPGQKTHARLRRRMGQLGCRNPRRTKPRPRGEDPRPPRRPFPRHLRRHPRPRRPVLRHRVLTNYRAEAEGITVEDVIKKVIELTPRSKPSKESSAQIRGHLRPSAWKSESQADQNLSKSSTQMSADSRR